MINGSLISANSRVLDDLDKRSSAVLYHTTILADWLTGPTMGMHQRRGAMRDVGQPVAVWRKTFPLIDCSEGKQFRSIKCEQTELVKIINWCKTKTTRANQAINLACRHSIGTKSNWREVVFATIEFSRYTRVKFTQLSAPTNVSHVY